VKLKRGILGIVSLAFTFLEEVKEVNVTKQSTLNYAILMKFICQARIFIERKNSANKFSPTVIDNTFNLCEASQNTVLMGALLRITDLFLPKSIELVQPFVHACPYNVSLVKNSVVPFFILNSS
jgi:hypothetical protein